MHIVFNHPRRFSQFAVRICSFSLTVIVFLWGGSRVKAEVLMNLTLDERIKSIQLLPQSSLWSEPVIALNSNQKLMLSFDDLSANPRSLEYRILHCDKNWNPSDLASAEYIAGFNTGRFDDIVTSFNTRIQYRNYRLILPNEDSQLKLSGNYCIEVFQNITPEVVLLRRQFYISENLVLPELVLRRKGSCIASQTQQLEVKVPLTNLTIQSAQQEISVHITQNGQQIAGMGNPILGYMHAQMADFSGINQACFYGGLEYRNFDLSDLRSQSLYVKRIINTTEGDSVYLHPSFPEKNYSARKDINGGYWVDRSEYRERSRSDAEYAWVNFELKSPEIQHDVFVMGEFCSWERRGDNWMQYDALTQSYKTCILLKQAYYNYQYFVYNEQGERQWNALQPSSSDTENEYGVFVYYRRKSERYDRLIAYRSLNSQKPGVL